MSVIGWQTTIDATSDGRWEVVVYRDSNFEMRDHAAAYMDAAAIADRHMGEAFLAASREATFPRTIPGSPEIPR